MKILKIGDLGRNRDDFIKKVNKQAGKGNWFWTFQAGKSLYSWQWGMQLYEDAYFLFFKDNASLLKDVVTNYSGVYELDSYDLESKLDYKKQLKPQDHYQDIAIRRCLTRYGLKFKGKNLLKLPDSDYDHKKIPFHLPHLINKPDKNKSIKSWLDSNRLIVITLTLEDQIELSRVLIK